MRWHRPVLLCAAVGLLHLPPALDLDVGIPPGSPITWGRRLPSITPRSGPLFPITPRSRGAAKAPAAKKPAHTVVHTATVDMDVHISSSFGVVRILTWDILNHLTWLAQTPASVKGPKTGPRGAGPGGLPPINDAVFWSGMSALLRLMLHPQKVSEKAVIAHLIEIGEPAVAVLGIAAVERSLAATCKAVQKRISLSRAGPTPLPGKTPRATMLKRFLADELTAAYPYDPEGGFGRRFLFMAEEFEPFLAEYVRHADSFLRRNAVAALARYRTDSAMQVLAGVAGSTDDPVVLMRSLAGLSTYTSLHDRSKILARLGNTKDPIERVALVTTVGRMKMNEAVPMLVRLANRKRRDTDLLQATLGALVRIRPRGDGSARKLAKRLASAARRKPQVFKVVGIKGPAADVPDTAEHRGEIIEQLAVLLMARLDPGNVKLVERVLAFGRGRKAGPAVRGGRFRRRQPYARNNTLGDVHPPVQILYLDTLRDLGEPGVVALEAVAMDATADPILRGHALSILPFFARRKAALAILGVGEDRGEDRGKGRGRRRRRSGAGDEKAELANIYALEVLDKDGHDQLLEICRGLLERCEAVGGGAGQARDRYLWLTALRALSRRHVLEVDELLRLMKHPEAREASRLDVHRRVRVLVERLVNAAAEKLSLRLHKQIQVILDLVIRYSLNKRITAATRDKVGNDVYARLAAVRGRKRDLRLHRGVTADILRLLLGFKMGVTLRERLQFQPVVLLDEEILLALGRTKTDAAAKALVVFLEEQPENPLLGHACLALGMTGKRAFAGSLLQQLEHQDGYIRFCAYEALRHLTAQNFFADWIYGEESVRAVAVAKYGAWLKGK